MVETLSFMSFVIQMETHYLLYFLEMPNQKEKVNIKPDDHLIGKWPCADNIQILDLFPKTVETLRRIRGKDVLWDLGCGDGVVLIEVWIDTFTIKISIGRVSPLGFFSL